jgi:hypothetical protein
MDQGAKGDAMTAIVDDTLAVASNRTDLPSWGTVRAGMALSFFGTLLTLLGPILFVVILRALSRETTPSVLVLLLLVCSVLALFVGVTLYAAGACMLSAAPPGTGVRGWGVAVCFLAPVSLLLVLTLLLAGTVSLATEHERHRLQLKEEIALLDGRTRPDVKLPEAAFSMDELKLMVAGFEGLCLLTLICHLLGLRGVARHFGRRGLGVAAGCFLLLSLCLIGGVNVQALRDLKDLPVEKAQEALQKLGLLFIGGLVFLKLWFLVLVGLVRRAVTEGMTRS